MVIKIPLFRPYFDHEEIKELQNVLASGWVTQGPKVKEFENIIANYLGAKYAIGVINCTAALHLSLLSVGIKDGDEVLVSDYTYPATGHSVMYCGAKPIFVDVSQKTYNIDPSILKVKITKKTKAIIPVHNFGQPAEMDSIMEMAEKHNLAVIEDAACALGAKYKNKYAGTLGHIGCFSFHARKGITTGEGGMVVTDNKALAEKIRNLSVFGTNHSYVKSNTKYKSNIQQFNKLGFNYKMSDITAAIGVAQLKKIDKIIKIKRTLANYYNDLLHDIKGITPPYIDEKVFHVYQSYVALLDEQFNRNKLIKNLLKKGIQTHIGTYASHLQPIYKSKDKCPNSLKLFNRTLALPIFYKLTKDEINYVVLSLKQTMEDMK